MKTIRLVPLLAGCAAVALMGCSASVQTGEQVVSEQNLEQGIVDALQKSVGQRPDRVDCPGSIVAKPGQSARCVLTAGGQQVGLTAVISSNDDGHVKYQIEVDDKVMSGAGT